jgi:hypothetical protein
MGRRLADLRLMDAKRGRPLTSMRRGSISRVERTGRTLDRHSAAR